MASNQQSFRRIYELKKRNPQKKLIVLISDISELETFDISPTPRQKEIIKKFWPGPYSLEFFCNPNKFNYLLCGTNSLTFRYPADDLLCKLLRKTGPLLAPSANPEGLEPAQNMLEAQAYFGESVPLYVDSGEKTSGPSTLLSLLSDHIQVVRGNIPSKLKKWTTFKYIQ